MIERLKGTLLEKSPTHIVVDCGGVGYGLKITLATFSALPEPGGVVELYTYLHVREDILQLYGFSGPSERELFLLLIGVNKIGPKTAQAVLSGVSVADFVSAITTGNITTLIKIPGIGRQSAERLVLELKGKLDKISLGDHAGGMPGAPAVLSLKPFEDAVLALESLGYKRILAEKAAVKVAQERGEALPVAEIIKYALKHV